MCFSQMLVPWGSWAAAVVQAHVSCAVLSLYGCCIRSGSPAPFGAVVGSDPCEVSVASSAVCVQVLESTRLVWSA